MNLSTPRPPQEPFMSYEEQAATVEANIYDPVFVRNLFDEMSLSYDRVNRLTSFGFSDRWRRQLVEHLDLKPGSLVCDLMCGMGECWPALTKKMSSETELLAIDNSPGMLTVAQRKAYRQTSFPITVQADNALATVLPANSADCVVSGFGLKTFSARQQKQLAQEISRILKPGGTFSLIEVSVPANTLLRTIYLFYLQQIIPILGTLLLGNPQNYKMLGIYTEAFGNCSYMADQLRECGLVVAYSSYVGGCATGIHGYRPE